MAKKFTGYAIAENGWLFKPAILCVVSTGANKMVYGMWAAEERYSSVKASSVLATYKTLGEADEALERVRKAYEKHDPLVKAASEAERAARQARRVAVVAAAVGRPASDAEA